MNYGGLTDPAIGVIMKEMVRRAIEEIRAQRFGFEVHSKPSDGARPDFVTAADLAAQRIYTKMIRECCPDFGVVAEEDGLADGVDREYCFRVRA